MGPSILAPSMLGLLILALVLDLRPVFGEVEVRIVLVVVALVADSPFDLGHFEHGPLAGGVEIGLVDRFGILLPGQLERDVLGGRTVAVFALLILELRR